MIQEFEITTILPEKHQRYEIIRVKEITFANGNKGHSLEDITPKNKKSKDIHNLAVHAFDAFKSTGLEDCIKIYPAKLDTQHNGERFTSAKIREPERLRLIYDPLPLGFSGRILRIYPTKGNIYLGEYDPKKAQIPLVNFTFCQDLGGSIDISFESLKVFIRISEDEENQEYYYSRNLKENR